MRSFSFFVKKAQCSCWICMIATSKSLCVESTSVESSNSNEMHHFHDSSEYQRYHISDHHKKSDLTLQFTVDKKSRIARNIRFMIWGLFFGVVAHGYLVLMNTLFPSRAFFYIVVKVIIDQVRLLTVVHCSVFGLLFQMFCFSFSFQFWRYFRSIRFKP